MDGTTVERLEEQSRELQRLIDEAQRIKREIDGRLSTLRHAGDACEEKDRDKAKE